MLQYLPLVWALCCAQDAPVLSSLSRSADRPIEVARAHLAAARAAATPDFPTELLLALAIEESHLRSDWVSGSQCDAAGCRRTIARRSRVAPAGLRGPYFCGILQMRAETWRACLRLRDGALEELYAGARAHLEMWRDGARCRRHRAPENVRCALRGYGGNPAANGAYAARVLRRARGYRDATRVLIAIGER